MFPRHRFGSKRRRFGPERRGVGPGRRRCGRKRGRLARNDGAVVQNDGASAQNDGLADQNDGRFLEKKSGGTKGSCALQFALPSPRPYPRVTMTVAPERQCLSIG